MMDDELSGVGSLATNLILSKNQMKLNSLHHSFDPKKKVEQKLFFTRKFPKVKR